MPLSFNSEPFFSLSDARLFAEWYEDFFTNDRWTLALQMSIMVALPTPCFATLLGTLAALGLAGRIFRRRR